MAHAISLWNADDIFCETVCQLSGMHCGATARMIGGPWSSALLCLRRAHPTAPYTPGAQVARMIQFAARRSGIPAAAAMLAMLWACGDQSATPSEGSAAVTQHSLVIAPFLQGEYNCDDAVNNPNVQTEDDAALLCASEGRNGADRIDATLNALGPASSPSGRYRLGYTLEIPAFRYFRNANG